MGFWNDLANFACNCVFFVGNVITETAISVGDYVQRATNSDFTPADQRRTLRQEIRNGLHELNLEILDLRRKWFQDGRLGNSDTERFEELRKEREEQKEKIWDLNESENAEKVQGNPNDVNSNEITADTPHILQYHIGQIAKNKKCPMCGFPMVLNFKGGIDTISMNNVFWTCTKNNFIQNKQHWHPVQPYQHSDCNIFSNEKIVEFECTNEDLTTIFQADQNDILGRIDQHNGHSIESYTCPFHGEGLVLHKYNNAANLGALEKYSLRCPHYNQEEPRGPDSCRYVVTLKSPAQLASALRGYEGVGILR